MAPFIYKMFLIDFESYYIANNITYKLLLCINKFIGIEILVCNIHNKYVFIKFLCVVQKVRFVFKPLTLIVSMNLFNYLKDLSYNIDF